VIVVAAVGVAAAAVAIQAVLALNWAGLSQLLVL
jgi:hypothetical protein